MQRWHPTPCRPKTGGLGSTEYCTTPDQLCFPLQQARSGEPCDRAAADVWSLGMCLQNLLTGPAHAPVSGTRRRSGGVFRRSVTEHVTPSPPNVSLCREMLKLLWPAGCEKQ